MKKINFCDLIIPLLLSLAINIGVDHSVCAGENDTRAESKEKYLEVNKEGDLISAEIKNSDISTVMEYISKKFDFEYKIFPEMEERQITISFEKTTLPDAVKKIVQDNYLLGLDGSGRINMIYILRKGDKDHQSRDQLLESFLNGEFISLEQLKGIVTTNVSKEYPGARLFTIIPHEDIRGDLISYIFSYYIGQNNMPPVEQVKNDINAAWKARKEAQKNMTEAFREHDSSAMIEWMQQIKPYDYQIRQPREYITLEIAASYDSPPVKKFYKGLPYDLAMYPNAVELLQQQGVDANNIKFKRTFIIDPLATGFEFRDTENNRSYYVDVLNNAVFDGWKEKERKEIRPDQEREKNIKKQWNEFLFQ